MRAKQSTGWKGLSQSSLFQTNLFESAFFRVDETCEQPVSCLHLVQSRCLPPLEMNLCFFFFFWRTRYHWVDHGQNYLMIIVVVIIIEALFQLY